MKLEITQDAIDFLEIVRNNYTNGYHDGKYIIKCRHCSESFTFEALVFSPEENVAMVLLKHLEQHCEWYMH